MVALKEKFLSTPSNDLAGDIGRRTANKLPLGQLALDTSNTFESIALQTAEI